MSYTKYLSEAAPEGCTVDENGFMTAVRDEMEATPKFASDEECARHLVGIYQECMRDERNLPPDEPLQLATYVQTYRSAFLFVAFTAKAHRERFESELQSSSAMEAATPPAEGKTTFGVSITIEGDADFAGRALEEALDGGALQEAIEDYSALGYVGESLVVTSVVVDTESAP
jgi:hypothetical protein